jgi:hypothetical protein
VEASNRVGWILEMFERWNSGDVDGPEAAGGTG